ncbi:Glycogen synthase [compost metagenome]
MKGKIQFYGWCQGERKQSFLYSLDALIVPSLYEPFGYVVLEAMEANVPLICSNRGGMAEIMGDSPFLFDPYESGDLQRAILLFQQASTAEIQQEIERLQGRRQYFGATRMRDNYRQLFEEMLSIDV